MDKTAIATRADIEEVTDLIKDVMQMMSDMLIKQDEKIESLRESTEAGLNRIENKLDPTIDLVDSHATRLKQLEQAAA